MCLAIPALITSVEGTTARAEIGGVERTISLALTPEARVGDYVLIHTGFAIGVVDEEEAQETLRLLEELAKFYPDEVEVSQFPNLPISQSPNLPVSQSTNEVH